jgi:acetyl-CoA carboxylase carboxyltransferase component
MAKSTSGKPSEDMDALDKFIQRRACTLDDSRSDAAASRHKKGLHTARENLDDLFDAGSFVEYGQLAVAAQRMRRDYEELKTQTAADGIVTGVGTVNAALFGKARSSVAAAVNDYTVLAGTQGYFHHRKLDRIMDVARRNKLPFIVYTEGGGGRPNDTDAVVCGSWQHMTTVTVYGMLSGVVPRIAVNNGFCFAGNAALFGGADINIATRHSWIGMAGPAMIEAGGLGHYEATEIGPADVHAKTGGVDLLVENEIEATRMAKKIVGYFQGALPTWKSADQNQLWDILPKNRRFPYDIRKLIEILVDEDSFVELQRFFAPSMVTGFVRIEGRPFGLIANDCKVLSGAIDAYSAEKAAWFFTLCDDFAIPIVSLCDTPGFMVGPDSEAKGAVRKTSRMINAGARLKVPLVAIFLRRAYGMGAMAMAGGSFRKPIYAASWPSGEFSGMGIEGAVQLGFKKELDAMPSEKQRETLYKRLLAEAYEKSQATEAASYLEIDDVIEPRDTRQKILYAIQQGGDRK